MQHNVWHMFTSVTTLHRSLTRCACNFQHRIHAGIYNLFKKDLSNRIHNMLSLLLLLLLPCVYQRRVLYAPLMLLCVVECCFCVPKHVSVINNLIGNEEFTVHEMVELLMIIQVKLNLFARMSHFNDEVAAWKINSSRSWMEVCRKNSLKLLISILLQAVGIVKRFEDSEFLQFIVKIANEREMQFCIIMQIIEMYKIKPLKIFPSHIFHS